MASKPQKKKPTSGTNKTRQAEVVIAALLAGDTYAAAAKKAGLGRRTVDVWMKSEWFAAQYQAARALLISKTIDMLSTAAVDAVRVLHGVANDRMAPHSARVQASAKAIDAMFQGIEMRNLETRLAELEKAVAQHGAKDDY